MAEWLILSQDSGDGDPFFFPILFAKNMVNSSDDLYYLVIFSWFMLVSLDPGFSVQKEYNNNM